MIAIDTNILVYSQREDSQFFVPAEKALTLLINSGKSWAIPWPCIHEFLAIVTHPKIYNPPTPLHIALKQVERWLEVPSLHLLEETPVYWKKLSYLLEKSKVTGPQIHDARIAALCDTHGVKELWSADRDFSRFYHLPVRNPMT